MSALDREIMEAFADAQMEAMQEEDLPRLEDATHFLNALRIRYGKQASRRLKDRLSAIIDELADIRDQMRTPCPPRSVLSAGEEPAA